MLLFIFFSFTYPPLTTNPSSTKPPPFTTAGHRARCRSAHTTGKVAVPPQGRPASYRQATMSLPIPPPTCHFTPTIAAGWRSSQGSPSESPEHVENRAWPCLMRVPPIFPSPERAELCPFTVPSLSKSLGAMPPLSIDAAISVAVCQPRTTPADRLSSFFAAPPPVGKTGEPPAKHSAGMPKPVPACFRVLCSYPWPPFIPLPCCHHHLRPSNQPEKPSSTLPARAPSTDTDTDVASTQSTPSTNRAPCHAKPSSVSVCMLLLFIVFIPVPPKFSTIT